MNANESFIVANAEIIKANDSFINANDKSIKANDSFIIANAIINYDIGNIIK